MRTRIIFALGTCALGVVAQAQTLSTLPPNNGSGGIFFDLTPSGPSLNFNSFATYLGSTTVGTPATIQVWTRPGSYVGFTAATTGWTLHDTVTGFAAGTTVLTANIAFTTPILLGAGTTTGIYLHSTTAGNGIRYQGTGTTSTSTFTNADLTLFSQNARTGAVPFGGSLFSPRAFAGNINYSPVPEPATMAVLGFGAAALLRRRRK